MKKYTKHLIIIGLALAATQVYSKEAQKKKATPVYNKQAQHKQAAFDEMEDHAVMLQVDAAQDIEATAAVLEELERINPEIIERIIVNEMDLEATFESIRKFVQKKIKEIEILLQEKQVQAVELARLAVELADAQALYQKTVARQKMKHKKSHKSEQSIKDSLIKAEQGIKALSVKAEEGFKQVVQTTKKSVKKATTKKKSQSKKSEPVVIADVAFETPDEFDEYEEVDFA